MLAFHILLLSIFEVVPTGYAVVVSGIGKGTGLPRVAYQPVELQEELEGPAFETLMLADSQNERPEILPWRGTLHEIGDHSDSPIKVMEQALPMDELQVLKEGILNLTVHNPTSTGDTSGLSESFTNTYTFEYTATLDGLHHAAEVLGLPVDGFLDRSVDPRCNAFMLNAVVVKLGSNSLKRPWHDFAVTMHKDDTLSSRFNAKELSDRRQQARTVVILYMTDVLNGGELELYDETPDTDDLEADAKRAAKSKCKKTGKNTNATDARRICETRTSDEVLANRTLGRLRPRMGRVVQFNGLHSHAVRRAETAADDLGYRVSLVLEQFHFPKRILQQIPTVASKFRGANHFANATLRDVFTTASGEERFFGSPEVWHPSFRSCLERRRSMREGADILPHSSVKYCLEEARKLPPFQGEAEEVDDEEILVLRTDVEDDEDDDDDDDEDEEEEGAEEGDDDGGDHNDEDEEDEDDEDEEDDDDNDEDKEEAVREYAVEL